MGESDQGDQPVELLEHADAAVIDRPGFDRRAFLRRTAMTGVAAGSVSTLLAACGSSASSSGGSGSVFGSHPSYKFVFINHVTTNPFFTPTQYGAADASALLGCSYQWTGSESSNVNQMVNALSTAVTAKADGIAVALIDLHAFNAPVEAAIKAGIPVVAYNADAVGNARLSYIGQDLKKAGDIEFTIDQQPYLQGFIPVLQLFMYKVSGTLSGLAETDTGLKFLDKESITPYVNTKSRYEGTATAAKVIA